MNTDPTTFGGANTDDPQIDNDGKPTSTSILISRYAHKTATGADPWYLNPNLFSNAFAGTSENAFASYTGSGTPASGRSDLLEVVTHELGHTMGIYSSLNIRQYASQGQRALL